jgi:thiol-disulfide isomerase/thioredoxin
MSLSRRSIVLGVAAAAVAQGAAYLLYRRVTRERVASGATGLSYEAMDRIPRGLEASLRRRQASDLRLIEALGQPLLLHFWATWCGPCATELPQLLGLATPRTLLVSLDEGWPVVDHFFAGQVPSQVVLDPAGEARRAFGVTTLPDTYLLDAAGRPLARFHGPRAWRSQTATQTLERLMAKP